MRSLKPFIIFTLVGLGFFNFAGAQSEINDPDLNKQSYLWQIKAVDAWSLANDSPDVIVAVIDTGVDVYHPDLFGNIWKNINEVPNDKIDNDNNGYIDDYLGWDFILNSPDPRPKFGGQISKLGVNHGTIVAGVIGAEGNNHFGLSGLSWKVKIMALRALNNDGSGDNQKMVQAMEYAISQGADIINISAVGIDKYDQLKNVLTKAYEHGIIITAAAGNAAYGKNGQKDLDTLPRYPICYDGKLNEVLGVASVDADDNLSSFSNYGSKCVDLVAPGEQFYSLTAYDAAFSDYRLFSQGYWSGTSLAAPLVAGTAALIKSIKPHLSNYQIYNLIKNNTDNINDKNSLYLGEFGSGRLNVYKSLGAAFDYQWKDFKIALAPKNGSPDLLIFNSQRKFLNKFPAYNPNFKGGFFIELFDFNNDGQKEILTSPSFGGGPHIRIFDQQGKVLRQFFAFPVSLKSGVVVKPFDWQGNGTKEIAALPQKSADSTLRIFDSNNVLRKEISVFPKTEKAEKRLFLTNTDTKDDKDLAVAASLAAKVKVKVFDKNLKLTKEFEYPVGADQNPKILSANIQGDLRAEFVLLSNINDQAKVTLLNESGSLNSVLEPFQSQGQSNAFYNLALVDFNNDGYEEIVVSRQTTGEIEFKVLDKKGQLLDNFFLLDSRLTSNQNFVFFK